jgi:hypothetical protein
LWRVSDARRHKHSHTGSAGVPTQLAAIQLTHREGFGVDLADVGHWRALSFIGLGLVPVEVGYLYQCLLFRRTSGNREPVCLIAQQRRFSRADQTPFFMRRRVIRRFIRPADPKNWHAGSVRNIVHDLRQRGVALQSIARRCRGRRSGRRITIEHHEREKPSKRTLAVCLGADWLGDVADRSGLGLYLPPLFAQSGALGFEVGQGWDVPAPASEHLAGLAPAINRRECCAGASALGRFVDGRIDLPPIEHGVGFDWNTRPKSCVLHLDGRLNRAPLSDMGGLRKQLRLAGPVGLLATTWRAKQGIAPDRLKRHAANWTGATLYPIIAP